MRKIVITIPLLFLLIPASFAEGNAGNNTEATNILVTLFIPALIGVIGYLLKSSYEVIVQRRKRKRDLIENKLKNFYWPILTRLEENEAIWSLILKKRNDMNSLEKNIGVYVEENIILKNHREIMDVIMHNRYLAKFDADLSNVMKDYFMHVAIYQGIVYSKQNTFPGFLGAPYPNKFDEIIKQRTEDLQKKLDENKV